ncbi:MAG: hypothetical protein WDN25_15225 [Acetobacteraceae bacterium]
MFRFVADPAANAAGTTPAGWPDWAPIGSALAHPAIRGRLGRWWVGPQDDPAALVAAFAAPRARLLLIPTQDALDLVRRLGIWLDAPRLAGLIRRRDIDVVRTAIGDDGWDFATRRSGLLARPGLALAEAVDRAVPMPDPIDVDCLLRRGAVALGLAIGLAPASALVRLRLRQPLEVWAMLADHCRTDAAGDDAWLAVRRLIRDRAPEWLTWLN